MIYNAQRLVDRTRRYVQDPAGVQQGSTFLDSDFIDLLNEEQDLLVAKMIESNEDWFGVFVDSNFVPGQNIYPIFDGCLLLRAVDFLGNPDSQPPSMIESRIVEGLQGPGGSATADESQYFYAAFGDDLHIKPTPSQAVVPGMRQWGARDPGPILLETLSGAGQLVDGSNFKFASVDAPAEDSILIGTRVDVVLGTGIGQRRKITAYAGATKQATVDTPFSPILDATSKIATESRIVRLFHQLLALGAALRAKAALEEEDVRLRRLYAPAMEGFEDFVYRARTYAQRSIALVDYDVV